MNSFQDFAAFQNSPEFNQELYDLGTDEEVLMLPTLKQFFNDDTLVRLPDGSHLDFVGKRKFIELKSRYINRLKHDDTAIGVDKIKQVRILHLQGVTSYFVFKFLDGTYYWQFDPTQRLGYRRLPPREILHYFIPIDKLTPLIV